MKYNVAFWELDLVIAKSMDLYIRKEIERLSEEFPKIIYVKTTDKPNSNRFVIRCKNRNIIDLKFLCYKVNDEKESINNSVTLKQRSAYDKVLSIINIGSSYFKAYKKHDLTREGIELYPEDVKCDEMILKYLENKDIDVLFTNCIYNFKYSKPEYMLDRVEIYGRIDNSWPTPETNRHYDNLLDHEDDIDENVFKILESLLSSSGINSQLLGEIIYKAIYPEFWKEFVEDSKLEVSKEHEYNGPVCTDSARISGINEINSLNLSNEKSVISSGEGVYIAFDEFVSDSSSQSEERPDIDSLIHEIDDDKNRRRK